jgi:hypothetical protein
VLAPLHDDVRIGANHRQATVRKRLEPIAIVVGRFGHVIEQPGAAEDFRFGFRAQVHTGALVNRQVPVRADMQHLRTGILGQQFTGDIARGDDVIIGFVQNPQLFQLFANGRSGPGGVGDQYDDTARFLAESP